MCRYTLPLQKYNTAPPPPPRDRTPGPQHRGAPPADGTDDGEAWGPGSGAGAWGGGGAGAGGGGEDGSDWPELWTGAATGSGGGAGARGVAGAGAGAGCGGGAGPGGGGGGEDGSESATAGVGSGGGGAAWEARRPRHWRMLWSPALWEVEREEGESGVVAAGGVGSHQLAVHRAWAAAQTIKFFQSGSGSGGGGAAGHDGASAHNISRALRSLSLDQGLSGPEGTDQGDAANAGGGEGEAALVGTQLPTGEEHAAPAAAGDDETDNASEHDDEYDARDEEGACECGGCGGDVEAQVGTHG